MPSSEADARRAQLAATPLQPVGRTAGLIKGTVASLRDIVAQRELLGLLVSRELRARYKNSSLGFVWSLVRPIAQLVIYFVVIGQFLGAARNIPQFAIYVFCGLAIWSLFNEILSGSTGSIVANSGLIKKVYLPREIFPLSAVGAALVNFGIQLVVLVAGTIIAGNPPLTRSLLYAPAGVVLILVFATAAGLLLAAQNVYLRDIQHLLEVVMLVLFWASPIVYSYEYVHEYLHGNWLEQLYLSNPVTLAVLAFQRGFWVAGADKPFPAGMPLRLAVATAISLVLLWVCQRAFSRLQGNFAQEL